MTPAIQSGWWSRVQAIVMDALFPPRCGGCGQPGTWWCATCQAGLIWLRPPLCPQCGQPQQDGRKCVACQREPSNLAAIRSAVLFDGPVRQAIHKFKYENQTVLAEPLGELLKHCWNVVEFSVDVIVPVPLHAARLRERGYNQSALLARRLAAAAHLPLVEDCLLRTRATASQMTLGAAERRVNVRGAFECADGRLTGKRVVLIDDVCTTGATLHECGAALLRAGAVSVWALTLARAASRDKY